MKKLISMLVAAILFCSLTGAATLAANTDETQQSIEETQAIEETPLPPTDEAQPIDEELLISEAQPVDETQPIEEALPMEEAQPMANELSNDLYISFTVTSENKDGTFTSRVYSYNLLNEKLEKVASVPFKSQYPLTAYDKSEGKVYYSYREKAEIGANAQLYSYDVDSKATKRLTTKLIGMNFIIPDTNRVLVIGIPTYAEIFALYPLSYEKKTGKLDGMSWNSDLNIQDIYSNPRTKELALSAFSASEQQKRIGEQDIKPYKQPPISVYKKDSNSQSFEKLFELEDGIYLQALARTGNTVVYASSTGYYQYDIASGTTSSYPHGDKLVGLEDFVYLSDGGRYIYYLRRRAGTANELCRLDTSNGTIKTIYSAKLNSEELNNATVLSGTRTKPFSTEGFKARASAKSDTITLTWKKNSSATGHMVYRSTAKTGTYKLVKTIKLKNTLRYNDKNLKKGKTYYYKLVPYTVVKGKTVKGPRTLVVKAKVRNK